MKFWQNEYTFNHPWATVTQAFWRKYPNELQSGVVGTDVVNRHIDSAGHLHSTRLIISKWGIPSCLQIFIGGSDTGFAVEHSIVDPVNKTMTLRSHNMTGCSVFNMHENITYKASADNTATELTHEAQILCTANWTVDSYAESFISGTLSKNAGLGLKAMEGIISTVESEAVSAFRCVEDFTSDALKSVDLFANEAIKSVDDLTSDTLKNVDMFATDTLKNVDVFRNNIDSLTNLDSITSIKDSITSSPVEAS